METKDTRAEKGTPKDLLEAIASALIEIRTSDDDLSVEARSRIIYAAVRERLAQDFAMIAHYVGEDASNEIVRQFTLRYKAVE